ncbi:lysoplasmalogenase family protein [Novosphingobium tardum]|uniref:Lysoplasmalogenase family protein n=1 Tax=Novosphingobium tardum TaxID=1538021 RepID=A0ABV8RP64_9SPHN
MPRRALAEKRPWLLASLFFGVTWMFVGESRLPGLYQIGWKGAGVGFLAIYAFARHAGTDGRLLTAVMALGAVGDCAIEIDPVAGGAAFFAAHLFAIALYARHRRDTTTASQKMLAVALLIGVPLSGYFLPSERNMALPIALYALALGGMAGMAWTSSFPRYRVGTGALLFVASDLLIFARMGPLANSALPDILIWPLYYCGQLLICTGVLKMLRAAAHPRVDRRSAGHRPMPR